MLDLKKILSLIADTGQKLFKKSNIKKNDLDSILKLCDELLSNKGMVFGITVARDITNLYQELSPENKLKFFKKINEKYKANSNEVNEAIKIYTQIQNEKNLSKLFPKPTRAPRAILDCQNGTKTDPELSQKAFKIYAKSLQESMQKSMQKRCRKMKPK